MSAPEPEPAEPGVASGAAELGVALERAAGPTLLHFTREARVSRGRWLGSLKGLCPSKGIMIL